jgi:N-methylhydantoinase B
MSATFPDGATSRPAPTQFPFGPLTADAGASADPVLVEIVQGSLASVELEVETAIARTSRSPMIRDAHDFRAGIHDRLLRKLTGRSYSALVHPVARDFRSPRCVPATFSSTTTSTAPREASGTCPTCA